MRKVDLTLWSFIINSIKQFKSVNFRMEFSNTFLCAFANSIKVCYLCVCMFFVHLLMHYFQAVKSL